VNDDAATLAHLKAELVKRYGSDYDVVAVGSSEDLARAERSLATQF
jgi:hypothetical protein